MTDHDRDYAAAWNSMGRRPRSGLEITQAESARRLDALLEARAERDRYRDALERIAGLNWLQAQNAAHVAREALDG